MRITLAATLTSGLAALLTTAAPGQDRVPDIGKRIVERPLKLAMKAQRPAPAAPGRVAPGRVAWHRDLRHALDAAKASEKPVLLFQLLGRLDDAFC